MENNHLMVLHLMYTAAHPDSTKEFPVTPYKYSVYCHFPFVTTPSLIPSPPHLIPHPLVQCVVGACHSVAVETLQAVLTEHPELDTTIIRMGGRSYNIIRTGGRSRTL